jgi:hypothetical protein
VSDLIILVLCFLLMRSFSNNIPSKKFGSRRSICKSCYSIIYRDHILVSSCPHSTVYRGNTCTLHEYDIARIVRKQCYEFPIKCAKSVRIIGKCSWPLLSTVKGVRFERLLVRNLGSVYFLFILLFTIFPLVLYSLQHESSRSKNKKKFLSRTLSLFSPNFAVNLNLLNLLMKLMTLLFTFIFPCEKIPRN